MLGRDSAFHDPQDDTTYYFDFSDWLLEGRVIAEVEFTVDPAGPTLHNELIDATTGVVQVQVSGAVEGEVYKIDCLATDNSSPPMKLSRSIRLVTLDL